MDYYPEKWTPYKTVLILKYMAWTLSGKSTDLAYTKLLNQFDLKIINELFPLIPYNVDPIIPKNTIQCEPQLGKRGLYTSLSTKDTSGSKRRLSKSLLNFLQYADGKNDLKQISKFINLDFKKVLKINNLLKKKKLIT